jgi:methylmalonyl-CoA mutase N-terminal domain/subunit
MSELAAAARTAQADLIQPMLAACRAEATLGEICDLLRAEWGEYTEPVRF